MITFILLNPSTADAERDDPTIRRCIGFAERWGYGRLRVVNLFALRATRPAALRRADDPVGPDNLRFIRQAVKGARVILGWGVHGAYRDQDLAVLQLLDQLGVAPLALAITRGGHPKHPLYIAYSQAPQAYPGRTDGRQLAHPRPQRAATITITTRPGAR